MTAPDGCVSTASSSTTWVVITAGCVCIGNGTVEFSVQANPSTQARSATIFVAGFNFALTQSGKTSVASRSLKHMLDEFGGLALNRPEMRLAAETFGVDLVRRLGP